MAEDTTDDHLYSANRGQTAKHFQSSDPPRQASPLRAHQPLHTLGANDLRLATSRTPPPAHMGVWTQGSLLQVQRPSPHGSPFSTLQRPSSRGSPFSQLQRPSPHSSPFAQLPGEDGGMTMSQLQSILTMPAAMLSRTSPGLGGCGTGSRASPVHPALSQGIAVLQSSGLVCPPRGVVVDRLPPMLPGAIPPLLQMVNSDAAYRMANAHFTSMPPSLGDRLQDSLGSDVLRRLPTVTVSTAESQIGQRDYLRVEREALPMSHRKSSSELARHLVGKHADGSAPSSRANERLKATDAEITMKTSSSSVSTPPALQPATSGVDGMSPESLRVGSFDRQMSASMPTLHPAVSLPGGNDEDEDKENEEDDYLAPDERKHPYNMRIITLNNLLNSHTSCRSAYRSHSVAILRAKAGSISNTAKSLDLLRQNLQKHINKEIDEVIQKYIKQFFQPGIVNIRANHGDPAINDEHVLGICRQVLEEAKKMYPCELARSVTPDLPDSVSESGSLVENSIIRAKKHSLFHTRKRRGSSDSDASGIRVRRKKGRPPLHLHGTSGRSTPSKTHKSEPVKRQGPKWDPDRIKPDTLFVMGAKANKALGLGATRGRLYIKHPDVFKYSGEQDDKQWLYENGRMPATGGKAYLLLVSDVSDLAQTDEYRGSSALLLNELAGFTLPEWILEKAKAQMTAMRTDSLKESKPSVTTIVKLPEQIKKENDETLPFSSLQYTDGVKKPPEEMAVVEHDDDDDDDDEEDDSHSISSFHLSGGFGDVSPTATASPVPSDLEGLDSEVTVPFELPMQSD